MQGQSGAMGDCQQSQSSFYSAFIMENSVKFIVWTFKRKILRSHECNRRLL